MKVTADFSHWVCVTESYLEGFRIELEEAIKRAEHIHAWQKEVEFFMEIWRRIIDNERLKGTPLFTITPEFGPPPYMWTSTTDNEPVADSWEINLYMKNLLRKELIG
jgi:hypothetical protein